MSPGRFKALNSHKGVISLSEKARWKRRACSLVLVSTQALFGKEGTHTCLKTSESLFKEGEGRAKPKKSRFEVSNFLIQNDVPTTDAEAVQQPRLSQ